MIKHYLAIELNTELKSLYNISCKDCDKVYVGQDKSYLKTRIHEHKTNYKKVSNNTQPLQNIIWISSTVLILTMLKYTLMRKITKKE